MEQPKSVKFTLTCTFDPEMGYHTAQDFKEQIEEALRDSCLEMFVTVEQVNETTSK